MSEHTPESWEVEAGEWKTVAAEWRYRAEKAEKVLRELGGINPEAVPGLLKVCKGALDTYTDDGMAHQRSESVAQALTAAIARVEAIS